MLFFKQYVLYHRLVPALNTLRRSLLHSHLPSSIWYDRTFPSVFVLNPFKAHSSHRASLQFTCRARKQATNDIDTITSLLYNRRRCPTLSMLTNTFRDKNCRKLCPLDTARIRHNMDVMLHQTAQSDETHECTYFEYDYSDAHRRIHSAAPV